MKLDKTYFFGSIYLRYSSQQGSGVGIADQIALSSKQSQIDAFITQYEIEAIEYILGFHLCNDYVAENSPLLQEQSDLLEHLLYKNGVGGTRADKSNSPVAKYVYWKYKHYQQTTQTMRGAVVEGQGNTTVVADRQNLNRIWHEFATEGERIRSVIRHDKSFLKYHKSIRCANKLSMGL